MGFYFICSMTSTSVKQLLLGTAINSIPPNLTQFPHFGHKNIFIASICLKVILLFNIDLDLLVTCSSAFKSTEPLSCLFRVLDLIIIVVVYHLQP